MNFRFIPFVNVFRIIFTFAVVTAFSACDDDDKTPDPPIFNDGCYPDDVAAIIVNKCATSGCHNTQSKDAASGLDLSTWEKMFLGNNSGATVIPYRSDQSTLCYFINTNPALGIVQQPTMPYNGTPLSEAEYLVIRDWIDSGAPNCEGFVKFSDNPSRKKFYIANQGCDLVGVHDAETKVIMRYVDVGATAAIESPHMIKVSPDGQFWYVAFINSNVLQKYRTSDDTFVAEANITQGAWNTFTISPDGTKAWVVDFSANGRVAYVNLTDMTVPLIYQGSGLFSSPHGSAVSPDGNTIYITQQLGDIIYKGDVTDPMNPDFEEIIINTSGSPAAAPHEVAFSPDGSKYFVTCQGRDEVRVFNATDDSFIVAIPTADYPLEMSFSHDNNYLFVTCELGNAVTVIDYVNLTAVKNINVGIQPHGVGVDDDKNVVYVANRNTGGVIPPHHTSACGGINGYLTIIDMSTLELVPGFKAELSVDPYSVSVRN
jgi:YVTN family beta-propeller protein